MTVTAKIDLGQLNQSLGFALRMSQLSVFEEFYAALGQFGMKPGEFSILYLLSRNPDARQGEIAERLRIKRAHMTKLVHSFDARGLILRRVPDDDRRAVLLRLTPEGEAFVADHAAAFFGYHAAADAGRLSAAERTQLLRLLRKFGGLED